MIGKPHYWIHAGALGAALLVGGPAVAQMDDGMSGGGQDRAVDRQDSPDRPDSDRQNQQDNELRQRYEQNKSDARAQQQETLQGRIVNLTQALMQGDASASGETQSQRQGAMDGPRALRTEDGQLYLILAAPGWDKGHKNHEGRKHEDKTGHKEKSDMNERNRGDQRDRSNAAMGDGRDGMADSDAERQRTREFRRGEVVYRTTAADSRENASGRADRADARQKDRMKHDKRDKREKHDKGQRTNLEKLLADTSRLKNGDRIEVTGRVMSRSGIQAIFAREISHQSGGSSEWESE